MSDDFKKKLESYENSQLEGEELAEFEKELVKLEQYQDHLEGKEPQQQRLISEGRQHKILRRSKWKARFQTAMSALGIMIIIMIISSILTALYYTWGDPAREEVFGNVIDHTLTITEPYGYAGGTSSSSNPFFNMKMTRDINKKVGRGTIQEGELIIPFFFSMMGYPERNMKDADSQNKPSFIYPRSDSHDMLSDWDRLEHLPEGTVVSAYISFSKLIETQEVFQKFTSDNYDLTWLAVDTGIEKDEYHDDILDPIGFPNFPIWHDDDMIQDHYEEEKGFLFGNVVTEGYSSPDYSTDDVDVFHKQFIKTLKFLEKHEKKVNRIYQGGNLNLKEQIKYLETNGIKHYGIVITGPTKEVLKLQNNELINTIGIDEVGFWNW